MGIEMLTAIGVLILAILLAGCVIFIGPITRVIARAWYAEKQAYITGMTRLEGSGTGKFD